MKFLFFFLMFASGVVVEQSAMAAPSMCVTQNILVSENESDSYQDYILEADLSCQEINRIAKGIDTAEIVVEAGSLYCAATGAGASVSVSLLAGKFLLQTLKLGITSLPCRDDSEKRIEANVKLFVCEQLALQGIFVKCNL